jgi:hypothetical protein
MSEPTIDEMLAYLNRHTGEYGWDQIRAAIIAILEQHRDLEAAGYVFHPAPIGVIIIPKEPTVGIIRAFVERVGKRWGTTQLMYQNAVKEELAAMEAEVKE